MIAFFYLLGQGLTMIFAKWWFSFLLVWIIYGVDFIITNSEMNDWVFNLSSLSGLFGWAGIVLLPEFIFKVASPDIPFKASTEMLFLWLMVESLVYLCLTTPLLFIDTEPYVWVIQLILHVIFIACSYSASRFTSRFINQVKLRQQFYIFWGIVLLINDLFLMVFNVWFSEDYPRDDQFYVCLFLATLTFFLSFFGKALYPSSSKQNLPT